MREEKIFSKVPILLNNFAITLKNCIFIYLFVHCGLLQPAASF